MGYILYDLILEQLRPILRVSKKDLEKDIKNITGYWETSLERARIKDRDTAIFLLTTYSTCYLSGRDIRMDNPGTLKENHNLLVAMVTLVTLYAWKQSARPFSKIRELVPLDMDNVKSTCQGSDILSQAERILREKNN